MSTGSLEPAPSPRLPGNVLLWARSTSWLTPLLLVNLTYELTMKQKSLAGLRQWLLLNGRGNQGLRSCWSYLCGSTLATAVTRQFAEFILQLRKFLIPEPVGLREGVHSKCGFWP